MGTPSRAGIDSSTMGDSDGAGGSSSGSLRCTECGSAIRVSPSAAIDAVSKLSDALSSKSASGRGTVRRITQAGAPATGGGLPDASFILVPPGQTQPTARRSSITSSSSKSRTVSALEDPVPHEPSVPSPNAPEAHFPEDNNTFDLAESQPLPYETRPLSTNLATLEELYRLAGLSSSNTYTSSSTAAETSSSASAPHSESKLPLCTPCAHTLETAIARQQSEINQEIACYESLIAELESQSALGGDPSDDPAAILARLQEEEQHLTATLAALELEEAHQLAADQDLVRQEQEMVALEGMFWRDMNAFMTTLSGFHQERDSLNNRYEQASRQLEKLRTTNVVNDVFRIWYDGQYGTIDGFRLGRHPSQPVDWPEINAGWGQACLMLETLAKRLGFEFDGYRLLPMGSTSKVQKLTPRKPPAPTSSTSSSGISTSNDSLTSSTQPLTSATAAFSSPPSVITTFDLHGASHDFSAAIGRFLSLPASSFDKALIAFLQCLAQLGEYCESLDPEFRQSYQINRERIGDVSIKMHGGGGRKGEESWAKACKYVLTNLKWIMAFVTKRVGAREYAAQALAAKGKARGGSGSGTADVAGGAAAKAGEGAREAMAVRGAGGR
ncbi:autophagy protein Apg6-domain-containing protein [Catenaria anguillulae PL171]|uniref:Autophagy protein Apg6-domain-containing protein n=1 Tax=Catenaria anguillulae PL171 TaxID=765915 RepID=A0A1Y2HWZ2_9FUNG|nr:autophagy protein Apg6-domain-containing protein [Catenaria anguillulae PL171]